MTFDGDRYQARFDRLSETGKDMHGESRFVRAHSPATVLDAGCGTGRVGIELARHGIDVVGVDVDRSMLRTARDRGSALTWIEADLCTLDLGRTFDVVLMAGNVPLFTPPGTQGALVATAARHLGAHGRYIAGFSTEWDDRPYSLSEHHEHLAAAGLTVEGLFATWDRDPWTPESTYAVVVAVHVGDA